MKTRLNTFLINASRGEKVGSFWVEDFYCVKAINVSISKLVERLSIEIFLTNKTQNSNLSNPSCCDLSFRFPLTFSLFIIDFFKVLCLTRVNWSKRSNKVVLIPVIIWQGSLEVNPGILFGSYLVVSCKACIMTSKVGKLEIKKSDRVPCDKILTEIALSNCIEKYWPWVDFVQTWLHLMRPATTSGQRSSVRLALGSYEVKNNYTDCSTFCCFKFITMYYN